MTTSQPQRSVDDLASTAESADADELCINTIRTFAMDAVQTAGVRAPWHSNAVAFPEGAEGFRMAMSGELPADWDEPSPGFRPPTALRRPERPPASRSTGSVRSVTASWAGRPTTAAAYGAAQIGRASL